MNKYIYILTASIFIIGQIKFVNNLEGITDPAIADILNEEPAFAVVDENELVLSYVFDEASELDEVLLNKPITQSMAQKIVSRAYSEKYNADFLYESAEPDSVVTREQFALMFYNLCADEPQINVCEYITDYEQTGEFYNEISTLYKVGIISGSSSYGHFSGHSEITPAVAKAMIHRLKNPEARVLYNPALQNMNFALEFECVKQNPELPTGCEVTSLTSVLNYYGYAVDKMTMADAYLDKGTIGVTDPAVAFVGNPTQSHSYGCYAPVIEKCAEKYLGENSSQLSVHRLSGVTFRNLLLEVEQGYPVIVWASMGMKETYLTSVWNIDGKKVTWIANEHCLVIYGFDLEHNVVYVADPLVGNTQYDINLFETRYNELLQQAVVIK